jgi:threonine synthase
MSYACRRCGKTAPLSELLWRCGCGGFLDVSGAGMFDKDEIAHRGRTIWRYREAYGLPPEAYGLPGEAPGSPRAGRKHYEGAIPVTLGEGGTPLVERTVDGTPVLFKLDFLNPSGSFKDRGASVLVTYLRHLGVRSVVEDSSGNAGAALSAYAAAAGLDCTVFVPGYTPEGKTVQMRMYGAQVVKVPGKRQDANDAAIEAAAIDSGGSDKSAPRRKFYASHLWHPFFIMGLESAAFELWEDLNRTNPDTVILPLGGGGYLEGLSAGFAALGKAGYAARIPKLIGVQSRKCGPLHEAFSRGMDDYADVQTEVSVAEGISVQRPPRARAVLEAIRASGGYTVAVDEEEILDAARSLARMGLYVEPTSAVTLAAWRLLEDKDRAGAVLILTGSGLKATAKYAERRT